MKVIQDARRGLKQHASFDHQIHTSNVYNKQLPSNNYLTRQTIRKLTNEPQQTTNQTGTTGNE